MSVREFHEIVFWISLTTTTTHKAFHNDTACSLPVTAGISLVLRILPNHRFHLHWCLGLGFLGCHFADVNAATGGHLVSTGSAFPQTSAGSRRGLGNTALELRL